VINAQARINRHKEKRDGSKHYGNRTCRTNREAAGHQASKAAGAKSKRPAVKKSTKASRRAKQSKTTKTPKSERVTKTTTVLELLHRKEGAMIAENAKETGWHNHGIRGFLSGTVTKKMGLAGESSKNEAGKRTCRID
jgi:hypothetical protein